MGKPPFYNKNQLAKKIFLQYLNETTQAEYQNGKRLWLRCLPYFHLIGFPKCGTTDLYYMLRSHHLIISNTPKEIYFWGEAQTGSKFALQLCLI